MSSENPIPKLAPVITCHAWNGDRTQLAICPNSPEIWIFDTSAGPDAASWTRTHVLKEHDLLVSGIDWSPVTNQIVSCSHDRNAFVWTLDDENKWRPMLVILRINRGALSVKWSPDGRKFAVASGAKCVPVCHYEEENKWWVSKTIKKHKSTVLSIDWHPNSQLLATGCADFKCRVFSAFIESVDKEEDSGPFAESAPFGVLLAEFVASPGHWVEAVTWSPTGNRLAFTSHGSMLTVVHFSRDEGQAAVAQCMPFSGLPFVALGFLTEDAFVAAGHDMNPALYVLGAETGQWALAQFLDVKKVVVKKAGGASSFRDRMSMFEKAASRGISVKSGAGGSAGGAGGVTDELWTKHENTITAVSVVPDAGDGFPGVFTSGLDGRMVLWKMTDVEGLDTALLRA